MKNTSIFAAIVSALVCVSADAQIQTLVTGTDPSNTNSAVITVSSNSYVVFESVHSVTDVDIAVTTQGATFEFDPLALPPTPLSGFTFVGPATIQVQAFNPPFPSFTTFEVVPLRKTGITNMQTLVVSPEITNSPTINVSSNSYAVVNSAATLSSANLLVNIQGTVFTYALAEGPPDNLMVAGPATIQLQATPASYAPSFVTVEVVPTRKSSRTQVQTFLVTPTNTNSPTLSVGSDSYATIASANTQSLAVLFNTVQGVPFIYNLGFNVFTGFTFTGPATFQLQGDGSGASFVTIEVTTPRK